MHVVRLVCLMQLRYHLAYYLIAIASDELSTWYFEGLKIGTGFIHDLIARKNQHHDCCTLRRNLLS